MEARLIYPEFFHTYISKVDTGISPIDLLEEGLRATLLSFKFLSSEKENYRYAPEKWSVKEVLGHIIDTEIIMAYRALCISRGEKASLPGFDEQQYVINSNFANQKIGDLLEHYKMVRFSNILLFKGFTEEMFTRKGISNGNEINTRALSYIIAGHEVHHIGILKERYGVK
ncbi:MAG TPA: DinB family protein [Cytophagales bacterium]|nr:DinB family protein [Cytophagales bacterium]